MAEALDEPIAAARYALIAPIVSRQSPLAPGELKQWLRENRRKNLRIAGRPQDDG